MGIKNNVAYTEGTVEQLGENVYFGTSNVQPSLWDNIKDYNTGGIVTTLASTENFSTENFTLFFSIGVSSQDIKTLLEISKACIYAYEISYEKYTSGATSEMRTKIKWRKMGRNPDDYIRVQYYIIKTGNEGSTNGGCKIINCTPMDLGVHGITSYIDAVVSSSGSGTLLDKFNNILYRPYITSSSTVWLDEDVDYLFNFHLINFTGINNAILFIKPNTGATTKAKIIIGRPNSSEVATNYRVPLIQGLNTLRLIFDSIEFSLNSSYDSGCWFKLTNAIVEFRNCIFNISEQPETMYLWNAFVLSNSSVGFYDCVFNFNNKTCLVSSSTGINRITISNCSGTARSISRYDIAYVSPLIVQRMNDTIQYTNGLGDGSFYITTTSLS